MWKERNGRRYLYLNERIGRRVVSHYIGRGEEAEFLAELLADQRRDRERRRMQKRLEREALESDEQLIAILSELSDSVTKAALLVTSFHQHHRGEWRRRRE